MGLRLALRVQGLEAMRVVTEQVPEKAYKTLRDGTRLNAYHLENAIRRRLSGTGGKTLRVQTGALRGSWKAERLVNRTAGGQFASGKGSQWRVASDLPYNLIHEFGGPIKRDGRTIGQMPARPFIAPAIDDWEKLAPLIWEREFDALRDEVQKQVDALRKKGFTIPGGSAGGN